VAVEEEPQVGVSDAKPARIEAELVSPGSQESPQSAECGLRVAPTELSVAAGIRHVNDDI
jgi:hypothetical protein